MGLDGVELLMEVEDVFGIKVSDEAASRMRTVGDLYGYIVGRLEANPDRRKWGMEQVRSAIAEAWGVDLQTIQPASRLQTLWPTRKRKLVWEKLVETLGHPLPVPQWAGWTGWTLVGLFCIAAICTGMSAFVDWLWRLSLIAWAVWVLFFAGREIKGNGYHGLVVRQEIATVERVVAWLDHGEANEGIWLKLQAIVAEQFGKKIEEIQLQTRFIEDLEI